MATPLRNFLNVTLTYICVPYGRYFDEVPSKHRQGKCFKKCHLHHINIMEDIPQKLKTLSIDMWWIHGNTQGGGNSIGARHTEKLKIATFHHVGAFLQIFSPWGWGVFCLYRGLF